MATKPKAQLSGQDGNVFNLMAIASKALKKAGMADKSTEMIRKITDEAKSYDEVLRIMSEYCELE